MNTNTSIERNGEDALTKQNEYAAYRIDLQLAEQQKILCAQHNKLAAYHNTPNIHFVINNLIR